MTTIIAGILIIAMGILVMYVVCKVFDEIFGEHRDS